MKFMMLVKHGKNPGPPPKELMDAIAILSEEAVKNRTMLGSGGLAPIEQSTRVRVSKGQLTVSDGPFTEAKEVVGGYAQFELKSKQEAIDGAVRFMELHRKYWPEWEGETEIRQIFGPEDFAQHINEQARKAG
ncbi:MAG: YciI family protein [Acidobacteriia bacterium]|nr:YciI family protein [Terriglobia bacterium]